MQNHRSRIKEVENQLQAQVSQNSQHEAEKENLIRKIQDMEEVKSVAQVSVKQSSDQGAEVSELKQ